MNDKDYKSEIINSFPSFEINTISYLSEGMDSVAFLVNNNYIFRFAKKTSGFGGGIQVEVKLLPLLEKKLDVPIPHFNFISETKNGFPFVGYKKIEGIPLTKEILSSLNESDLLSVFDQLSKFFQNMHSFSIGLSQECGVKEKSFEFEYRLDRNRVYNKVYPLLTESQQKYFSDLLDNYLNEEENFEYKPSLLHADLWLEHIFFDEKQKKVSGIIDFGDVIIGDPDYDFMQIHQNFGDKSLDLFEKFIPEFNKQRVKSKAVFFQQWNIVQDLMFFQDVGDAEGVEYNLNKLVSFVK